MAVILQATGHTGLRLALDLAAVERALEDALFEVRALRSA